MKRNKKILTENKVQQLMNLKNFAQVQTFKKILSNIFNVSLDNGDIHYIFERLNIPFSIMNVRGVNVKYYKRDAIIEAFYKGLLNREVENLVRNRTSTNAQPTIQIPGYRKSVVVNTSNRYIPNNNNSMEDEYEYPNGENDMEKYSEYLINDVYEEKKNMDKITINENDIKTLVTESIKNILKEGFDSTQIDMFDSSRNGETEVEKSKKLKNAARNKKAAETRADNKRKEKIEALRQFEKDHPESDLFKDDKTVNEAFFNKFKRNPYDHNQQGGNFSTQPLKDGIGLYDIRQRVQEIIHNCNPEDIAIAKKQAMRLYKMVDAMINQGKNVN